MAWRPNMDISSMIAGLLKDKLNLSQDAGSLAPLVTSLFGGDEKLDVTSIMGKLLAQGGLNSIISSWQGNGANDPIEPTQLAGALDDGALNKVSSELGVSSSDLLGGLADVLPGVVDQLTQQPSGILSMLSGFMAKFLNK